MDHAIDSSGNLRNKDIKRQTLVELVDYVSEPHGVFNESMYDEVAKMVSANLFRTLPPSMNPDGDVYDPEEV